MSNKEETFEKSNSKTSNIHLGKYLRREIRSEYKQLAFQVKLLTLIDPSFSREIKKFHALEPLNHFLENDCGMRDDITELTPLTSLSDNVKKKRTEEREVFRRPLKLLRRRIRNQICEFVEKVHLLRMIDPSFETEIHNLGFAKVLCAIDEWHAAEARNIISQKNT